ncbi:hypothetical protein ACLMJK_005403 [Lecanora helva]
MTARPNPVNRTSTSKASSAPLESNKTALVSSSASLTGSFPIKLGAAVIIQPRSLLSSAIGPIAIGESCIISERASIINFTQSSPQPETNQSSLPKTSLAEGVLIECGAEVEAASIGAFTVIEAGATVGKGAVIGSYCKVCARVQIGEGEVVADGTVVFGSGWGERRAGRKGGVMEEKREAWVKEQGEVLRKLWTGK